MIQPNNGSEKMIEKADVVDHVFVVCDDHPNSHDLPPKQAFMMRLEQSKLELIDD
jgi:hypothetical protein